MVKEEVIHPINNTCKDEKLLTDYIIAALPPMIVRERSSKMGYLNSFLGQMDPNLKKYTQHNEPSTLGNQVTNHEPLTYQLNHGSSLRLLIY